ncbi:MAG: hypothetical protein FWD45_06025 [Coriobacteriia bacterium]|nr:hypothetical protein [Coriobacteriia bacterium]
MQLFEFRTSVEFEQSMRGFYRSDPLFKNNKSGTFRIVCNPRGAFYQNTAQRMIGVSDRGETLCQCVLIKRKAYDKVSVAFFEAKPNATDAVSLMMDAVAVFAKTYGANQLDIALDGHCSYGVGFAQGASQTPPLFGESYNPEYYNDFFYGDKNAVGFTSYTDSLANIAARLDRLKHSSEITVEPADFRNFNDSIRLYTALCNSIFSNHRFCFYREEAEDLELFSGMKPLLSPHNLLFAKKDNQTIGFLLMYPDFNELVPAGGGAGVGTFIQHKVLRRPINTMKIVQIGVLPEFQSGRAIVQLFAEAIRLTRLHNPSINNVVSSWILDENRRSMSMVSQLAPKIHRRFFAYEKEV